jgi:hypothetical protein
MSLSATPDAVFHRHKSINGNWYRQVLKQRTEWLHNHENVKTDSFRNINSDVHRRHSVKGERIGRKMNILKEKQIDFVR